MTISAPTPGQSNLCCYLNNAFRPVILKQGAELVLNRQ